MIYLKNTTETQKLYIPKESSNAPYSDYYYTKQQSDERFASKEDLEDLSNTIDATQDDVAALETKVADEKTWYIRYDQNTPNVGTDLSKEDFLYLCKTISEDQKPVNIIFTDLYQHYPQFFYADYDEEDLASCNIYALCKEDDVSSEYDVKIYIRVYFNDGEEYAVTESSTLSYDIVTSDNIDDYAITPGNFGENVSKFGIPWLNVTDSMPTPVTQKNFTVKEGFDWVITQMQNNIVPLFVLKFIGNANYFFVKGFDNISKKADGKSINGIRYIFVDQTGSMEITVEYNSPSTTAVITDLKDISQTYYFLRFSYPYNSSEPAKTGYDYGVSKWNNILKSTVIIQAEDSTSATRKLYTATGLHRVSAAANNKIYFTLEDGTKTAMTLKIGSGDSAQILSWLPITEEQNEA